MNLPVRKMVLSCNRMFSSLHNKVRRIGGFKRHCGKSTQVGSRDTVVNQHYFELFCKKVFNCFTSFLEERLVWIGLINLSPVGLLTSRFNKTISSRVADK